MKEERKLLTDMARRNGGVLKVEDVITEASKADSILHKHFEWDNTKAAESYRKEQARSLIQRCKITLVEGEPVSVRAFVSLPTDRESGGGYRLTSEVISNESQKEELLRDIQLTIARWSQKLHLLDQDIAELLEEVDNRINSKTTQPQQAAA